jgi:hypothetical protein
VNPSTLIITNVAVPAVALIALGVGLLLVLGSLQWRRSTDALRARLVGGAEAPSGPPFGQASLDTLPPPVARYLRFALVEGQPRVRTARLASQGEFRRSEGADAWIPFKAEQLFTAARPGFVWDARMRVAPGVAIRVVDAYVDGSGTMRAAVAGIVSVVDAPDTPVLAAGELMRWLAETPWLPTALLPGGCVQWTPLDDDSARATVEDGGLEVSADFRFGPEGEVREVFFAERPRDVDGTHVPTPWSGRFGAYEERSGMRIPGEGVVQWHLPGGELPYWRGRITAARYETGVV